MIFVLAVSEFGVPGLLRVRVFTTEVFTAFAALYDFSRATILALPSCCSASRWRPRGSAGRRTPRDHTAGPSGA